MRLKGLLVLGLSFLVACASEQGDSEDGADSPEATEGAWDAESVDKEGSSTHLWIVNRAVDIVAKHAETDETAKKIAAVMNEPACRSRWQQGLYDADFKAVYNNGRSDMPANPNDAQVALAGATWESHFFDPDTGKNYKGTAPTAYSEANAHLGYALENHLDEKTSTACYELGLTLHYYTDLTQPMHASNFTALDRPVKLHSNLEGYSMEIQARFPLDDWSEQPATMSTEEYIMKTARDSKPLFMEGVKAVVAAYKAYTGWHILTCRNIDAEPWRFIERQHLDYKYCWAGNAGIDAMVGKTLKSAQDHTAQFLYLIGEKL